MPRQGWKSISVSENLIEKIDKLIEEKKYCCKSRIALVTYAINRLLNIPDPDVKKEDAP